MRPLLRSQKKPLPNFSDRNVSSLPSPKALLRKPLVILGLIVFFAAVFAVVRFNHLYSNISTRSASWHKPIPKEQKVFNVLMMGYGGPGHDGAYLTDTMMFMSIDTEHKRVTIVSLPRDIWVRIPTNNPDELFMRKINSVYQTGLFQHKNYPGVPAKYDGEQGAGDLLKETVQKITGQPLDYYVAIDFSGFKKAVDTLGGVSVNVERTFTDVEYPIDGKEGDLCGLPADDLTAFEEKEKIATKEPVLAYPCRYETLHFDAGLQTMDGATALKFVRSRHSLEDGGDFNRARRQQVFMEAVRDRVLSIGFLPKILPLMNDLESSIRTDLPLELVNKFIGEAPHAHDYVVKQIVLTTDNYLKNSVSDDGQYILEPRGGYGDWDAFQADLKLYLDGKSPTPTVSPTPLESQKMKKN